MDLGTSQVFPSFVLCTGIISLAANTRGIHRVSSEQLRLSTDKPSHLRCHTKLVKSYFLVFLYPSHLSLLFFP